MTRLRTQLCFSALAMLVAACQQQRERTPSGQPSEGTSASVAIPIAEPPLDRSAVLLAVVQAASAAASGEDDRARQRELDGKPFEFRIRFGCGAPDEAEIDRPRGWRFDESRRILRVRVQPEIDMEHAIVRNLADDGIEAVEGFIVERPWMLTAACSRESPPAQEAGTQGAARGNGVPKGANAEGSVASLLVAIARFYSADQARSHRRNQRAYEATGTLGAGEVPGEQGFDLVLSGRLRQLSDGRVIPCRIIGANSPPSCIVSAQFDTVAIERAETGEPLARWSSG